VPDAGFAVQPRDGFHLTEFADFVRPTHDAAPQPVTEAPEDAAPAADGKGGKPRGWHIRSSRRPNTGEADDEGTDETLDEDAWEERRLIDADPAVAHAHGDVNDLLRRRKCDEAASLLQKLAADHGSRSVAELALDAGDRCRALGKGNAALSCYIAASRADPSFEAPLMRLADVCLDDRDIDLAVTYLERVAKLHRQRGDNRGALRLYRKIATIAPYRDDILATLMRANTTGQFED
jgi:tetratricopeptide (TPR) repeat protein